MTVNRASAYPTSRDTCNLVFLKSYVFIFFAFLSFIHITLNMYKELIDNSEYFSELLYSTCLQSENQVEGLPLVFHTRAVMSSFSLALELSGDN